METHWRSAQALVDSAHWLLEEDRAFLERLRSIHDETAASLPETRLRLTLSRELLQKFERLTAFGDHSQTG